MTSNASLVGAAMLLVILLAVYGYVTLSDIDTPRVQQQAEEAGIANPASTHCRGLGGSLEIRESAEGQVGYCHLPDGRACEEWQLFRDGTCVSE
jgi:uncharacterized protein